MPVTRLVLAASAAAVTLGVAGFAAGATGALRLPGTSEAPASRAVAYDACPGAGQLGVVHGGDRVFVTGRDDSDGWVQIRDPWSPDARVWLDASAVRPDADLASLPVVPCGVPSELVPTSPSPASSSTTEPGTPVTTPPQTPVTTPAPTPATTPAAPSTTGPVTTVPPPDTVPPVIGPVTPDVRAIYEMATSCGGPFAATLTVPVTDVGSGVASVTATWAVGGQSGPAAVAGGGGVWTVTLGPFPTSTLVGHASTIVVTITATDRAGNATQVTDRSVLLWDCG